MEWNIADAGDISSPTYVDLGASGEFSLSVPDFMFHNWGTSSSLVDLDVYDNNMFWAAWSDQIGGASNPNQVWGCVGYVN